MKASSSTGIAFLTVLAAVGLSVWLSGCGGSGLGGEPISGTVFLDGEPAEEGAISLEPVAEADARSIGAAIIKGKFNIPADAGALPGKYKAKVITSKLTGKMSEGPGGTSVPEMEPVKIKEAEGVEVTIVKGGPNNIEVKVNSDH